MKEDKPNWWEYLRFITPLLLTIALFMISQINQEIKDLNTKMFVHLTNEEIHTPRGMVVSQEAFTLYQTMRDSQMADIKTNMVDIKELLKEHTKDTKNGK